MGYVYPDTREALWLIVERELFAGKQGTPYFHMTTDFEKQLPAVQIILLTGVEGFLERVDRVQVDVYAEGSDAADYANALHARLVGENLTVAEVGLFDRIESELVPHDVPYPSDRTNVCSITVRATTRPQV